MVTNWAKNINDSCAPWETEEIVIARARMVDEQLVGRGIRDPRVLMAFREIPRHLFVPESTRDWAYKDGPLPIGHGQTISQPYIVALMTEVLELKGTEKVLEIGTGSGYQAAILSRLVSQVITIERIAELADIARVVLNRLSIGNVTVCHGNGTLGHPEGSPFDGIIVTAGAPDVPEPLIEQLSDGGRLVLPVGDRLIQTLVKITKSADTIRRESLGGCAFVPLIGSAAWKDNSF